MIQALANGLRSTAGAPLLLVWLWVVNIGMALPAAWVLANSIESSIGASRVHEKLTHGFDGRWFGEFAAGAKGIGATFEPSMVGAGAFYANLESWLTGKLFVGFSGLVGLGLIYAVVWAFLLGSVLNRFAGDGRKTGLMQAGGRYFFRFVRLALISGGAYLAIYKLQRWIFGRLEDAFVDVTSEKTVLAYTLSVYLLTALLLTTVHVCFGYAKIATVVDDRRSMLLAAARGLFFVIAHPVRCLGLYWLFALCGGLALLVYSWLAPGIGQQSWVAILLAFAAGQLFLGIKLFLRVSLWAGQASLYRSVNGL